jgi:hypothetical protein
VAGAAGAAARGHDRACDGSALSKSGCLMLIRPDPLNEIVETGHAGSDDSHLNTR